MIEWICYILSTKSRLIRSGDLSWSNDLKACSMIASHSSLSPGCFQIRTTRHCMRSKNTCVDCDQKVYVSE